MSKYPPDVLDTDHLGDCRPRPVKRAFAALACLALVVSQADAAAVSQVTFERTVSVPCVFVADPGAALECLIQ